MKDIFRIIFAFSRMHDKFLRLKGTEEGEKSIVFGVKGIVYALITGALLVVCYFAFGLTSSNDWGAIVGFILLVVGAASALLSFLYGIYASMLQLKLNKKAIGFISLLFQIAAFASAIVVILIVSRAIN